MYLKRLKVRNFKSFAGATEIPFQPGFTGVAGPNGMGKSNISDAILFVLGPTSSKALRAERLPQLFFNGGASKKAATECEVSLVFDNSDHLLPSESSEVEVTRYVKLAPSDPDGYYSYFYVNGKRSTQAEIDGLLGHARLSGDGYNLVQQGDVNKIVTMGPIPRRGLVERLSGISQYDEELERAATKREDVEQNLGRIDTLLGEVKGRLTALEGQRLQAIQYKQLTEERRKTEARLARTTHRLAEREAATCRAQVDQARRDLERLDSERQELAAREATLTGEIDRVEREIAEAGGEAAQKFKAELDEKKLTHARAEQALANLQEALDALGSQVDDLAAAFASDQKQRADARSKATQLEERLSHLDEKVASQQKEIGAATSGGGKPNERLAQVRKLQLELDRKLDAQQRAWQEAVSAREGASAAAQAAEQAEAQAEGDLSEREVEVKDLELRLRDSAKGDGSARPAGELQKELFALREKEKSLTAEAERLGKEILEADRRYLALDARLKARADSGGRPNALMAVDFLLSQRNLGRIEGIRGTVEELAEFDPKHRTALQFAAGPRFQALVVETDRVAEQCIQLLREEKRGRATFLPLNRMLSGRPHGKSLLVAKATGALGFAIDLVKFDEALRPAFWYAFGETVIMNDLAAARAQMGGVRLVTLNGDLIEGTGAISGGYVDPSGQGRGGDNPLELKRLADELRQKHAAEAAARTELAKLGEKIRVQADELAARSIHDETHRSTRVILDKDLAAARERLKVVRGRLGKATEEKERASAAIAQRERELATIGAELDRLKKGRQEAQEQYLGQLPQALSLRLKGLQEETQATQEERLTVNGELQGLRASIAALDDQLATKEKELGRLRSEAGAKRKELTKNDATVREAAHALEALKAVEAKQGEAARSLVERRKGLEGERLKVNAEGAKLEANLTSGRALLVAEETRSAEADRRLAELEEALRQYPEPEADEKPLAPEELKRRIAMFDQQVAALGDVNQRAVEEYDGEKARLDEFSAEVERLTKEKSDLVALVAEIEKKKRERLVEVVREVDTNYRSIYAELSAGGEGKIALENEADPLAGGLLIEARPVGKTVNRLEQLSGGEKSLASLAFIFALQRYDPSPLYVLDEVDMSLDALNAENIGRMVRRNAERAQFIMISLRKVTLKFARQLFGVTMRGDGCSRVVGLGLDDIKDVDERDLQGPIAPPPALEAR
ncbi:MAG TPA: chromosome segregation protein SMC [Thermoplasmata archaeon]|nr:chromosome segregation protein SMC [Thermoplasmata archaeon]